MDSKAREEEMIGEKGQRMNIKAIVFGQNWVGRLYR